MFRTEPKNVWGGELNLLFLSSERFVSLLQEKRVVKRFKDLGGEDGGQKDTRVVDGFVNLRQW